MLLPSFVLAFLAMVNSACRLGEGELLEWGEGWCAPRAGI